MDGDEREITLKVSQIEPFRCSDPKGLDEIINKFKAQAGYSGFTNFETYRTYLHLKNVVKITNRKLLDTSPTGENIALLAEHLSENFQKKYSNLRNYDFYTQILVDNAIAKVNWKEIAIWLVDDA